ncbi:MAG: sensor histidine kinase [Flavobacteriales bacterium]|nr:sensor histidine kinase [Flavobacteriales bacterium]MCB9197755.1 sensor histidine kinase [Flavobacteriales bacterium]
MTSLRGLIIIYWLLILTAATYLRTAVYDDLNWLIISSLTDVLLLFVQSFLLFKIIKIKAGFTFFKQGVVFVIITLLFTFFRYWLEGLFFGFGLGFQNEIAIKFLFTKFMTSLIISGVTVAYLIFLHLNQVKEQKHKTELEKKQMEIEFLKSRVNPHFLFNSLGCIHSLAMINSEKTPLLIEKLSDLMRYTFYDCQQPLVPIKKEIEFIKSFIDFHQIKAKEQLNVSFDFEIDNETMEIEPLLFISTIENAYKHGNVFNGGFIQISLCLKDELLTLSCENSRTSDTKIPQRNLQSGFGVKNLVQRLETHYPNQHKLQLSKEDNSYLVTIEISIHEKI